MLKKSNSRSFRYTDETAKIIEKYNNDLDKIVYEAYKKIKEKEKLLKELEAQIEQAQKIRNKTYSETAEINNNIKYKLKNLEREIDWKLEQFK